ncbi:Hypothetical protein SRAE_1000096400 [Strongyloides ratti]|uniref:Uncharacterized protein n=1 Tax=Strongyloides ratti TaxID=34506 RepID=A0A090L5G8_STRRB|nr:Hypothetical protein SRAE_1000096400 [Strongyloides ratti]CEF62694.1 Hypothetical protein SRAE_1000096400 [Strongyloides ratti]
MLISILLLINSILFICACNYRPNKTDKIKTIGSLDFDGVTWKGKNLELPELSYYEGKKQSSLTEKKSSSVKSISSDSEKKITLTKKGLEIQQIVDEISISKKEDCNIFSNMNIDHPLSIVEYTNDPKIVSKVNVGKVCHKDNAKNVVKNRKQIINNSNKLVEIPINNFR